LVLWFLLWFWDGVLTGGMAAGNEVMVW